MHLPTGYTAGPGLCQVQHYSTLQYSTVELYLLPSCAGRFCRVMNTVNEPSPAVRGARHTAAPVLCATKFCAACTCAYDTCIWRYHTSGATTPTPQIHSVTTSAHTAGKHTQVLEAISSLSFVVGMDPAAAGCRSRAHDRITYLRDLCHLHPSPVPPSSIA